MLFEQNLPLSPHYCSKRKNVFLFFFNQFYSLFSHFSCSFFRLLCLIFLVHPHLQYTHIEIYTCVCIKNFVSLQSDYSSLSITLSKLILRESVEYIIWRRKQQKFFFFNEKFLSIILQIFFICHTSPSPAVASHIHLCEMSFKEEEKKKSFQ